MSSKEREIVEEERMNLINWVVQSGGGEEEEWMEVEGGGGSVSSDSIGDTISFRLSFLISHFFFRLTDSQRVQIWTMNDSIEREKKMERKE